MDPCGWVRLFVMFFFHWFRGISDVSKKKRKKEDFLLAFSSEMAAILLLLIACLNFRIPPDGELVSTWFYWVLPIFFCLVSDRWPWFPDDWFVGRRCGRWCWFDGSTCASATVGVGPDRWLNSYPTADGFFFLGGLVGSLRCRTPSSTSSCRVAGRATTRTTEFFFKDAIEWYLAPNWLFFVWVALGNRRCKSSQIRKPIAICSTACGATYWLFFYIFLFDFVAPFGKVRFRIMRALVWRRPLPINFEGLLPRRCCAFSGVRFVAEALV